MASLPIPSSGHEAYGYLQRLQSAKTALERVTSLDELKAIRDVAVAADTYARAKRLGLDAQNYAAEVVLRADRRLGELLTQTPRHPAGRPAQNRSHRETDSAPRLRDLGIGKSQSSRAQQIAKIDPSTFENYLSSARDSGREITAKRLLRLGREADAQKRRQQPTETVTTIGTAEVRHGDFRDVLTDLGNGSVDAIVTDPPYAKEFLELYSDLAELAARVLTPAGVLAVMVGQAWLPQYLAALSARMRYRWCGAYLTQGARTRMHTAKVGTGWKPVLIYQHPDADELRFLTDDLFAAASGAASEGTDKRHHRWGQSEAGTAEIVDRLTRPGQLVADPFLGGGTTALVCRDLGRRFIGCDVDAAAVAAARERIT